MIKNILYNLLILYSYFFALYTCVFIVFWNTKKHNIKNNKKYLIDTKKVENEINAIKKDYLWFCTGKDKEYKQEIKRENMNQNSNFKSISKHLNNELKYNNVTYEQKLKNIVNDINLLIFEGNNKLNNKNE